VTASGADINAELRALVERHCQWLDASVGEIAVLLSRNEQDGSCASRQRAREIVHQIVGTSGSVGFAEVSAVAGELQAELRVPSGGAPDDGSAPPRRVRDLLIRLQSAAVRATPECSSLIGRFGG